jgi:DNA invertase Pin-like site-specific DNA recombinase
VIAAYLRVSSASQSAATQKSAIAQAARARGHAIGRWYSDTRTGAIVARPALDELRSHARRGKLRRLYVYRLDRLTRSGIRDTLGLIQELQACGVELVSIADGFDLTGPAADVVVAVLAWAAAMERLALGERIRAARARIEAKGGAWGRPRRMGPELVARARRMRREGRSLRAIAMALRVPRSTVGRSLAR